MKNIAIIPARSGSKGCKDKNIKPLNGIPLMGYSINCARESKMFSKILVSTDSEQYAAVARKYGATVPFLRSEKNSGDRASTWDAVREVIELLESQGEYYDNAMLLQPTSPLRTAEDICNSFQVFEKRQANSVQSVTMAEHSPIWCNVLPEDGCMDTFIDEQYIGRPRQSLPVYYRLNGAIYLFKRGELNKKTMFRDRCFAYVMPNERSIDIDTELDFRIAEWYMGGVIK